ncbi:hypothetical protein ES708_23884 [subsurface metagenome]
MTYNAACILYYKWLGQPGNQFMLFIPWYHEQGITIEPDAHTKALIEATGYPGHSITQEIIDWIQQAVAAAIRKLTDLIDDVKHGIQGTIENILYFFGHIWNALSNILATVSQIISTVATGILNAIKATADWISTTIGLIVDKIVSTVKAIADWLKNVYEHVKEAVIGAFTSAIDGLKLALESVKNWIKTVATNIWNGIKAVGTAISTAFHATIDWVRNKFIAIYESVKDVFITVKDWIVGVYDSIGLVITNMIDGIKEGFKTGLDSVIIFLQDLWGKVTTLLDSLFDLSEEALSKVFVQIFYAQKAAFEKLTLEAAVV